MDNSSSDTKRVIICGAGIAGLTLAWWLDRTDWEVLLVEKASGLRDEGYMIDFFDSGYDVAKRMGILPRLEDVQYDIPRIINVNRTGQRVSQVDYELFRRLADGRLLALMRGDLERVLYDALSDTVEIRYERTVDEVTQDDRGVDVRLNDESTERVDLLVGADGIHSRIRKLAFGDEDEYLRYLGYHTASYIFEDESFRGTLSGDFKTLTVSDRVAGFYPIRGNNVATWFAHRTPEKTLPSSPCDELTRNFDDLDWIVPDALAYCGQADDVYYDQVAQIEMDR